MIEKLQLQRLLYACFAAAGAIVLSSCTSASPEAQSRLAEVSPPLARANPQMIAVLDEMQAMNPKPIETLSAREARLQPTASDAVIQLLQKSGDASPDRLPPVAMVEMKSIPGPSSSQIPVRVYTPPGKGPFPVVMYFHGGGWVIGSLDAYDSSCRVISLMSGAVVVSVDYRLAPENKFPAAPEDCYAATQYVMTHAPDFGGDASRVAVAGESAGGNLATVVCLMAKQRGGLMPIEQTLIYPVTNDSADTPSYQVNAQAKPLNAAMMSWFFNNYLGSASNSNNILVSPLRANMQDLIGLPPATIVTDDIDPLQSEGIDYGKHLSAAGVKVAWQNYTGVTHEFFGMGLVVDTAKAAEIFVTDQLKSAFR